MKTSLFIPILLLQLFALPAYTQVVTTDPSFPTAEDSVTIIFDASKGNQGLFNCNCDVYLHTGVITSQSNAPSDWKYVVTEWGQAKTEWKMVRSNTNPNLYSFTIAPDIRTFYKVPTSETIQQLAFVFRNADGSKAGRAADGSDIFTSVFSGQLSFQLLNPTPTSLNAVSPNEVIRIKGEASLYAQLQIFDNDSLIYNDYGIELDYSLTASEGAHRITIVAAAGSISRETYFSYFTPSTTPIESNPYPDRFGYQILPSGEYFFSLFAPEKSAVYIIGSFNNWLPSNQWQMNYDEERQTFWLVTNHLSPSSAYTFQYLVESTLKIADPYSKLVLDPDHDPFIDLSNFENLPPYPSEETTGIVSVISPKSEPYNWNTEVLELPKKDNLIIYELLLRDFLHSHSYADLTDTLSYLKRLGINAIELMPINEFEGNISWGYNPSFHMALDKYYGSAEELKRFVDACHQEGIAVLLDVVYNHAFSQSPLAQLYWDSNNNRPSTNNPWLNTTPTHPFNVGYDFNHDSPATQAFVKRVLTYWLEEFHIDGFRFDLSKGFTQRVSFDDSSFRAYDQKRVAVIKQYGTAVHTIRPDAYLILEHFADQQEENELAAAGFLLWSGFGLHHQYLEAAMGYPADLQQVDYRYAGFSTPSQVTYIESHDEERVLYKTNQFGNQGPGYNIKNLQTGLERSALASLFFYPLPGPKMMWQFKELGFDYTINHCPEGPISENCRTAPKPIVWQYRQDAGRQKLYHIISALNHLKKEYEVFQNGTLNFLFPKEPVKIAHLQKESHRIALMGNFGTAEGWTRQTFPSTGLWYEYFSGDSLMVSNQTGELMLAPGEYRLYSNQPIGTFSESALTTSRIDRTTDGLSLQLIAFPNPIEEAGRVTISFNLHQATNVTAQITNLKGQVLNRIRLGRLPSGQHQKAIQTGLLSNAMYLLTIQTSDGSRQTIPLIKH